MNRTPRVSVVIGFLNAGKFLAEAIESVAAQTYPDWELILVDDGSTDNGTQLAQTYVERYPDQVRYFEHPGHQNRGVCASRNFGVREARGEFIALLDADDVWLPHKLEQQVAIMDSHPEVGLVYGGTQYWYSWTGVIRGNHRNYIPDYGVRPNSAIPPPAMLMRAYPLGAGAAPCPSNLLLRREVVDQVGGFEEDFRGLYQLYEDQAFLVKVYLHTTVFVSSECWARYRQHSDSCMSRVAQAGQYYAVRGFFLRWLEAYLRQQDVHDPAIQQTLQRAMRPYRYAALYQPLNLVQHELNDFKDRLKRWAKQALPPKLHLALWNLWQIQSQPPTGWVRFGSLRRVIPISREFGFDRGQPVDRYYIENFLTRYADDIQGRVLEIGDNSYTMHFGGARVRHSDVLHVKEGNPHATFVGDLTHADQIPAGVFDCVILTQTLHLIYDVPTALRTVYRILKPGGVLLATVPGISQISEDEWGDEWYWSFTPAAARRTVAEVFPLGQIWVESHGNVLAASAFLYGLAAQELRPAELDSRDPYYPMLVTIRAVKPKEAA